MTRVIRSGSKQNAIEMLYGGPDGFKDGRKTELFRSIDRLRSEWQEAKDQLDQFQMSSQRKQESHIQSYKDRVDDAYEEYKCVRDQIKQLQAAIVEYTRDDPSTLLLQQRHGEHMTMPSLCTRYIIMTLYMW